MSPVQGTPCAWWEHTQCPEATATERGQHLRSSSASAALKPMAANAKCQGLTNRTGIQCNRLDLWLRRPAMIGVKMVPKQSQVNAKLGPFCLHHHDFNTLAIASCCATTNDRHAVQPGRLIHGLSPLTVSPVNPTHFLNPTFCRRAFDRALSHYCGATNIPEREWELRNIPVVFHRPNFGYKVYDFSFLAL